MRAFFRRTLPETFRNNFFPLAYSRKAVMVPPEQRLAVVLPGRQTMNHTTKPPESTLAADEFAMWIEKNRSQIHRREHYQVRPCKSVRGFMLHLPGIGWKLWFPTVADAVSFARRVASIYAAECFVYDSTGQKIG